MDRRAKTYVVVASGDVLYRLGIKTILSVIGLEFELIETDDYARLKALMLEEEVHFFVISKDVLPDDFSANLAELLRIAPEKRVMCVGDPLLSQSENLSFVDSLASQKDVLESFQHFFFDVEGTETQNGNVLTEREIDVLRQVALGLSNKEIADRLFISTNTVITHRKNITEKLGIKTIPGLTVYAIMNNVIQTDEVKY